MSAALQRGFAINPNQGYRLVFRFDDGGSLWLNFIGMVAMGINPEKTKEIVNNDILSYETRINLVMKIVHGRFPSLVSGGSGRYKLTAEGVEMSSRYDGDQGFERHSVREMIEILKKLDK